MQNKNEEDLLRQLFAEIKPEKAPDGLTGKVMDQILADPVIEPVRRRYFDWWLIPAGLLSIPAFYVTGVHSSIYKVFAPYFIQMFSYVREYLSLASGLLPSNVVVLPSMVIPVVILSGLALIMMTDIIYKREFGSAGRLK